MRPRGLSRSNQEGVAWHMRNRTDAPELSCSLRTLPSIARVSHRWWKGTGRRVMLLASGAALLAASAAHAANGRIAFEVPSPRGSSVKTVNPDGSQQAAMPGLPNDSGQATWSANGMLLAFFSPHSGLSQIWAINAAGKRVSGSPMEMSRRRSGVVAAGHGGRLLPRAQSSIEHLHPAAIPHRRFMRLTHRQRSICSRDGRRTVRRLSSRAIGPGASRSSL